MATVKALWSRLLRRRRLLQGLALLIGLTASLPSYLGLLGDSPAAMWLGLALSAAAMALALLVG